MKKLNITSKFAPIVASGVLILTGCGTIEQDTAINDVSEVNNTSTMEEVTTTTDVTTTKATTNTKNTTTTTVSTTYGTQLGSAYSETRKTNPTTLGSAVTDTRTTTTTADTTTKKTIKHPGESGYNEFNNHLTDILGEYNTYSYVDGFESYIVMEGDDLKSIASKFNTSMGDLIDDNHLTTDKLEVGQVLKYRVKDEYLNIKAGRTADEIATVEGIDVDEILKLNDIPEYNANTEIGRDAAIKLHRYVGYEDNYETHTHKVNVIYNNRVCGDKIVYATGFAGSSQRLFVLDNSRFIGNANYVYEYQFDGGDTCISKKAIMRNAKDIDTVQGLPVAYLRDEDDLQTIASEVGTQLDEMGRMQWESSNLENYPVSVDEFGNEFIAYSGYDFGTLDADKRLVLR